MKRVFQINQEDTGIIQPVLNIRVGEKHLATAITDHASGRLKQLFYYTGEEETGPDAVREIMDQEEIRAHSFYQVKIGFDHAGHSLVPAAGFRHEDAGGIRLPGFVSSVLITEHIPEWQLYNVYPVPGDIHQLLMERFPGAKCWHQVTISLRNCAASETGGALLVDIRHTEFTVLAARAGKLLLAETYPYSSPEDMIYYLLSIHRQFALSQNDVQLELSGLIDRESALYKDLYQYFIHIRFREADWKMNGSGYPAHFFTSLNDLAKCAS